MRPVAKRGQHVRSMISRKQGNALTEDLREMFKSGDFKKLL
jgi:hypothetical protein